MFGKLGERRRAKKYEDAMASWQQDHDAMDEFIATAEEFRDGGNPFAAQTPHEVHAGERVVLVARNVGLVEPKRQAGQWVGGYSGFSFRIAKGVSYRVGGTRGHFVQGEEVLAAVDAGDALITDKRVAFTGKLKAREWLFAKLLGLRHDPDLPRTFLPVSNREATSGIMYPGEGAPEVRFRISLAVALFNNRLDELVDELKRERDQHDSERPVAPATTLPAPAAPAAAALPGAGPGGFAMPAETGPAGPPPPGWYGDPSGRHAWRYYDGAAWTSAVSDGAGAVGWDA